MNTTHNKGQNPRNTVAAWNCDFCHATNGNSQKTCGCARSLEAAGRKPAPAVNLDSIELVF